MTHWGHWFIQLLENKAIIKFLKVFLFALLTVAVVIFICYISFVLFLPEDLRKIVFQLIYSFGLGNIVLILFLFIFINVLQSIYGTSRSSQTEVKDIAKLVSDVTQEQKQSIQQLKSISELASSMNFVNAESENINKKVTEIAQTLIEEKKEKELSTWNIIEDLINEYHKQALSQASIQFWFSLIVATIGFVFIVSMLLSPEQTITEKSISFIPGAVIEVISVLFFKQAQEIRKRATELYETLRQDNQRNVSIQMIESIEDVHLKSVVKSQLALKIGGVDVSIKELSEIVNKQD